MKKIMMTLLAIALPFFPMSSALSAEAIQAFGFSAASIKGFPTGEARLTGGGAYDLPEFVQSAGGFRCLEDIKQGPLESSPQSNWERERRGGRTAGYYDCGGGADTHALKVVYILMATSRPMLSHVPEANKARFGL